MPRAWDVRFPPLLDSDVRGYRDTEGRSVGPGRRGIWEDGREVLADDSDPSMREDGAGIPLGPTERHRRDGTGQTRFKISWIWRMDGVNVEEAKKEGDYSSLRPDWARSRARVHRCKEELQLLLEEMRRTLDFLKYKASWWEERAAARATALPELAEGLASYAASQAEVQMSLSTSFVRLWRTPLGLINERQLDEEAQAASINAMEPDVILDDDDADGDGGDDDDSGDGHDNRRQRQQQRKKAPWAKDSTSTAVMHLPIPSPSPSSGARSGADGNREQQRKDRHRAHSTLSLHRPMPAAARAANQIACGIQSAPKLTYILLCTALCSALRQVPKKTAQQHHGPPAGALSFPRAKSLIATVQLAAGSICYCTHSARHSSPTYY